MRPPPTETDSAGERMAKTECDEGVQTALKSKLRPRREKAAISSCLGKTNN